MRVGSSAGQVLDDEFQAGTAVPPKHNSDASPMCSPLAGLYVVLQSPPPNSRRPSPGTTVPDAVK